MNRNKKGEDIPLVIIAGWSGSGKTTFLEKLIPEFRKRDLRVGAIKHHHGEFELDRPGKDSWRHKEAGAEITLISSPEKIGMIMDMDHDPGIDELTPYLLNMDIIVVEGYKGAKKPKVEIFRSAVHDKPRFLDDPDLIAIVSDIDLTLNIPEFRLDDVEGLVNFLIQYFGMEKKENDE